MHRDSSSATAGCFPQTRTAKLAPVSRALGGRALFSPGFAEMSRQHLGQNFLADAGWRARILRALHVQPGELWLEIGAGHGEMTAELARQGARVIAVELDSKLLPRLQALAAATPGIAVVAGDILQLDFARLAPGERLKIFGSLPYYISSPILHKLFAHVDRIAALFVI